MSTFEDRGPPRRRRAGGMHPGWACFFNAWLSGQCTAMAFAAWGRWALADAPMFGFALVLSAMAILLFVFGGRRAERLVLIDKTNVSELLELYDAERSENARLRGMLRAIEQGKLQT